jgi:hypothetical protein
MNDKEPKEIKQGFDIPYPELNAPSVKIGGDAVKVVPTEESLKESWKKI